MMPLCPLYNSTNLNFTGSQNPYGLIQQGGKRKSFRRRKSFKKRKTRKTRKYRR